MNIYVYLLFLSGTAHSLLSSYCSLRRTERNVWTVNAQGAPSLIRCKRSKLNETYGPYERCLRFVTAFTVRTDLVRTVDQNCRPKQCGCIGHVWKGLPPSPFCFFLFLFLEGPPRCAFLLEGLPRCASFWAWCFFINCSLALQGTQYYSHKRASAFIVLWQNVLVYVLVGGVISVMVSSMVCIFIKKLFIWCSSTPAWAWFLSSIKVFS